MRPRFWCALIISCLWFALDTTPLKAATISANSCSHADVSAAVNRAVNGDTVLIPAGTCSWTSNLTISNKYLTLQGAGIDVTVIIDNVNKGPYPNVPQALLWYTIDGGLTRLTGITWQGGTTPDSSNKGTVVFTGQSHHVRIDHCKFVPTTTAGMMFYGGILGVADHNYFNLSNVSGYGFYHFMFEWSTPGSDYGDRSIAAPVTFGTDQAMFFEDNVFVNNMSKYPFYFGHDGWGGNRIVVRHNSYSGTVMASHGTESPGRWRGLKQFEIYNNTMNWNMGGNAMESWFDIRSGVGVIFNNTATVTNPSNGLTTVAYLKVFRTTGAHAPWGKCDGSSAWDGNTSPPGYPCLDQVGWSGGDLLSGSTPTNTVLGGARWPRQTRTGVYIWNNTINGAVSDALSQQPTYIQSGREYFNRTPKPGYVPYTYPHPLVTASGSSNAAPAAPKNLVVN